jgi:hypothetical protein
MWTKSTGPWWTDGWRERRCGLRQWCHGHGGRARQDGKSEHDGVRREHLHEARVTANTMHDLAMARHDQSRRAMQRCGEVAVAQLQRRRVSRREGEGARGERQHFPRDLARVVAVLTLANWQPERENDGGRTLG